MTPSLGSVSYVTLPNLRHHPSAPHAQPGPHAPPTRLGSPRSVALAKTRRSAARCPCSDRWGSGVRIGRSTGRLDQVNIESESMACYLSRSSISLISPPTIVPRFIENLSIWLWTIIVIGGLTTERMVGHGPPSTSCTRCRRSERSLSALQKWSH